MGVRKSLWWILTALIPAVTLAAMTLSPANLEKALTAQRQLAAEHPGDAMVFNDLGNLLVLSGRVSEAEEAYRRSLEIDPNRSTARFNLGLLLQQLGRNREALGEYQKVVKQDPSQAWAHYQIGTLYEAWHQEERAIKAYAQAFSIDPQLAFPEVNPHVIDNGLVTEALLRANRKPQGGVLAPKAYEDPGRIADLLVPRVPVPSGEEGAETETEAAAEQPVEETVGGIRTLTEGDLNPDASSNQAAPLGQSLPRYGTTYRPPRTVVRPPTTRQPIVRPQSPPTVQRITPGVVGVPVPRGVPSEEPDRTRPQEDSQGRVQIPSRTPTGFQPGLPSSGRLEMRLLPWPTTEPIQAAG